MAEVATTAGAVHLDAVHAVAVVVEQLDVGPVRRLGKARPTRAGVELGLGGEELGATAGTAIRAAALLVEVLPGERPLGSLVAQHVVLLRAELLAPLAIGLLDAGRGLI